jgi:hypothetical protein
LLIAVSILTQETFAVRLALFVTTAAVLAIFAYSHVRSPTAEESSHG